MEGIEGLKAQCYLDVDVWFPPFRSDLPNPHLSHYNQKVRLCEKKRAKKVGYLGDFLSDRFFSHGKQMREALVGDTGTSRQMGRADWVHQ